MQCGIAMGNKQLKWCFKLKDGLKIVSRMKDYLCLILAVTFLLGDKKTNTINKHKDKRIDAQYYMKVDQEIKIRAMLQEAKIFISSFDELVSNLSENNIKSYR